MTVRPDEALAVNTTPAPIVPVLGAVKLIVWGVKAEIVRLKADEVTLGEAVVSVAITECVPVINAPVTTKDHVPVWDAVVVPITTPSILIEIVSPAGAVPVMVGVVLFVLTGPVTATVISALTVIV